jgi:hypothetical protein
MDYLWIVISALLVFAGNLFWRRARAGKRGALFNSPAGLSFLVLICFLLVVIGSVGLFIFTGWLKALGLIIVAFFISALFQK